MPELQYRQQDGMVRLKLQELTNHETREILVGLWSRIDPADQEDHISELQHYFELTSRVSPVAQGITHSQTGERTIDMGRMLQQEGRSSQCHGSTPSVTSMVTLTNSRPCSARS